jgi:hypothetical protein
MPSYPIGGIKTFAYQKLSGVVALTSAYDIYNSKPEQSSTRKFIYFEVPVATDKKVVGTERIYADGLLRIHVVGTRDGTDLDLYSGISTIYTTLNNQQFESNDYGQVLVCVHQQDLELPFDEAPNFTPRTVMEFRVLAT